MNDARSMEQTVVIGSGFTRLPARELNVGQPVALVEQIHPNAKGTDAIEVTVLSSVKRTPSLRPSW
jgi:hypothetical protein